MCVDTWIRVYVCVCVFILSIVYCTLNGYMDKGMYMYMYVFYMVYCTCTLNGNDRYMDKGVCSLHEYGLLHIEWMDSMIDCVYMYVHVCTCICHHYCNNY